MQPTVRQFAPRVVRTPSSFLMLVVLLSGTLSACSTSEDPNADTSSSDDNSIDTRNADADDAAVTDDNDPDDATGDEATGDATNGDATNGDSTNSETDDPDAAKNTNGAGDAQPPSEPNPDLPNPGVNVSDANGQTGSVGGVECFADAECVDVAQGRLDDLAQPSSVGSTFDQAECIMAGLASGPSGIVCECTNESDGSLTVGLDCARRGRHGECVYPADEFPGCELGVSESCDAVCSDLQARLEAAAAQTYETELRTAYCDNYTCVSVSRIDETCHVNGDYIRAYDCSQSDEDIVSQHQGQQAQDQPPPCDSPEAETSDTCYEPAEATEE